MIRFLAYSNYGSKGVLCFGEDKSIRLSVLNGTILRFCGVLNKIRIFIVKTSFTKVLQFAFRLVVLLNTSVFLVADFQLLPCSPIFYKLKIHFVQISFHF